MESVSRPTTVAEFSTSTEASVSMLTLEGSIIQSASWTLKEEVHFSRENKQSVDWASYPILRFDEVPDVEVELMARDDMPALGVGESAQGPTAAAIANAVFHASGSRSHRLPLK